MVMASFAVWLKDAEGALLGGGRWTCFVEPPVMGKKRKKSSSSSSEVWCSAVENVSSFDS